MARNKEIRKLLISTGILQWQVAERLGITASWLSVKLRTEMSTEDQKKILDAIKELIEERKEREV